MQIHHLHVPACPNLGTARSRLRAALERTGIDASIDEVEVDSVETATAAGMHGSPTIAIDGSDPFAPGGEATLSCRMFRTDHGLDRAPSVEQLVAALQAADAS